MNLCGNCLYSTNNLKLLKYLLKQISQLRICAQANSSAHFNKTTIFRLYITIFKPASVREN